MENQTAKETFRYTYSAKEQEEVKQIRQKYMPKEPDKMEQLRKLDERVTRKGVVPALVVGIFGSLILGVGMCCAMVWDENLFVPGIVIGLVDMAVAAVAYPLYTSTTRKERERIAPEIIRLANELMS